MANEQKQSNNKNTAAIFRLLLLFFSCSCCCGDGRRERRRRVTFSACSHTHTVSQQLEHTKHLAKDKLHPDHFVSILSIYFSSSPSSSSSSASSSLLTSKHCSHIPTPDVLFQTLRSAFAPAFCFCFFDCWLNTHFLIFRFFMSIKSFPSALILYLDFFWVTIFFLSCLLADFIHLEQDSKISFLETHEINNGQLLIWQMCSFPQ